MSIRSGIDMNILLSWLEHVLAMTLGLLLGIGVSYILFEGRITFVNWLVWAYLWVSMALYYLIRERKKNGST